MGHRIIEYLESVRDPGSIPHLIVVIPFFWSRLLTFVTLSACATKLGPVLNYASLKTGATLTQPPIQKLGKLNDSVYPRLSSVFLVTAASFNKVF